MTNEFSPLTLLLLERLRDDLRAQLPQPAAPRPSTRRLSRVASQVTILLAFLASAILSLAELQAGG